MKTLNISDLLKQIPQDRVCLKSKDMQLTYAEMLAHVYHFCARHSQYSGARLAVSFANRMSACINLPALAELADALFIQPSDIPLDVLESFYRKADIHFLVKCSGYDVEFLKVKPVEHTFESTIPVEGCVWNLATSGTSGVPKLVSYTLPRLVGAAKRDLDIGRQFIWGLVYDINRFAGLQVYLQVLAGGSTLVVSETEDMLEDIIKLFSKNNVNALSATPTFWRKLLMTNLCSDINFERITLGGEICDQNLLNSLRKVFINSKLSHIYASTEAGVGFSVKDGLEGFPLCYLDESPDPSISLKISDSLLWIKSPRSAEVFVSGTTEIDSDGFINTGDLVSIHGDRVIFGGRDSGSINVGGNKVTPEVIEHVLLAHPAVASCHVYGKKSSMMGMLVVADVVLADLYPPDAETKNELISHCKSELEQYKVPALIKFVNEIRTNATGKINRKV
jgi:acyl-coenzyme A synthetase/AMP-(fatty) acid ligase